MYSEEIEIVPAGLDLLDDIYDIEQKSFSVPWSKRQLADDIAKPESIYYAAIYEGCVIGYAGMWYIINEGHITNIAVQSSHRRRGVGAALLGALIAEAVRRGMVGLMLEVRTGNYDAQRLYMKNGFILERIRKNYYSDTGEDALVLWKALHSIS